MREWTITILVGAVGFLAGSNVSGWAVSSQLRKHEMEGGHSVMENRMDHVEIDLGAVKAEHDKDMKALQDKMDMILLEIREIKEK